MVGQTPCPAEMPQDKIPVYIVIVGLLDTKMGLNILREKISLSVLGIESRVLVTTVTELSLPQDVCHVSKLVSIGHREHKIELRDID